MYKIGLYDYLITKVLFKWLINYISVNILVKGITFNIKKYN